MFQYSFESSDESATKERIDDFVAAAATCREWSPGEGVDLTIEPITEFSDRGEAFAAVHAGLADNPKNERDYVVFRNGVHVTVLMSDGRWPRSLFWPSGS